jgi:hypothetical protein
MHVMNKRILAPSGTLARRIDTVLAWTVDSRRTRSRRVTRSDIAACVPGASAATLEAWAAGRSLPDGAQLEALAWACGVRLLWLSMGQGEILVPGPRGVRQMLRAARRRSS